jgi:hypothetical protein
MACSQPGTYPKASKISTLTVWCPLARAGDMETPDTGSWNALPPELQELIVANLSLVEVTRISSTCRHFYAAFCRQLAQEQKARCDLAAGCIGHQRILRIKSLMRSFLNYDGLDPDVSRHSRVEGWIYQDGTFHAEPPIPHVPGTPKWCAGDYSVHVSVGPRDVRGMPPSMDVMVNTRHCSHVRLATNGPTAAGFEIMVNLCSDADLEELGLVQSLFSTDLGRGLQDAGVEGMTVMGCSSPRSFSQAGVEAQIAPLLPFLSELTIFATWLPQGYSERREPHTHEVESVPNKKFSVEYYVDWLDLFVDD